LVEIFEHKRVENKLELFLKFESTWKQLYKEYIHNAVKLVLIVGQDAGFTDTRVVFLWLKTHSMFYKIPLTIMQLKEFMSKSELFELFQKNVNSTLDSAGIVYSSEPRIGKL
jgi:hypothetical protein